MSNLAVFDYNNNSVRIVEKNGEPWFVAKDLCAILEIKNVGDALNRLDSDEKQELTGQQVIGLTDNPNITRLSVVSESGMYALVLSSRKPEAKPFRKWVTAEVLPSIRKTGQYAPTPITEPDNKPSIALISEATDYLFAGLGIDTNLVAGCKANAIARIYPELTPLIEENKRLVSQTFGETERLYSPTELGQMLECPISGQKVNKLLESAGLQTKGNEKTPWVPTKKGESYSKLLLDTAKGHNKTVYCLRWKKQAINALQNYTG